MRGMLGQTRWSYQRRPRKPDAADKFIAQAEAKRARKRAGRTSSRTREVSKLIAGERFWELGAIAEKTGDSKEAFRDAAKNLRKRGIVADCDLVRENGTWANLAALSALVKWSAGLHSRRAIAYCRAIVDGESDRRR